MVRLGAKLMQMNSGGAYYNTAVDLRKRANEVRELDREDQRQEITVTIKMVGYEIAAALYCVAQALEDLRG